MFRVTQVGEHRRTMNLVSFGQVLDVHACEIATHQIVDLGGGEKKSELSRFSARWVLERPSPRVRPASATPGRRPNTNGVPGFSLSGEVVELATKAPPSDRLSVVTLEPVHFTRSP